MTESKSEGDLAARIISSAVQRMVEIFRKRARESALMAKRGEWGQREYFKGNWLVWRKTADYLELMDWLTSGDEVLRTQVFEQTYRMFGLRANTVQDDESLQDKPHRYVSAMEDTWRKAETDFEILVRAVAHTENMNRISIAEEENFCEHPWTYLRVYVLRTDPETKDETIEEYFARLYTETRHTLGYSGSGEGETCQR